MIQDHHPLAKDFPELKDKIHALKTTNAHFAKLEREYEDIDKAIVMNGPINAFMHALAENGLKKVSLKDYRSHALGG